MSKKKGKGKTPKDSALLHGMESLQVLGGREMTVGKQNPGLWHSHLPREMRSGQGTPVGKATPKAAILGK